MRRTRLVSGVAMALLGVLGCSDPTKDLGNECPGVFDIEPPVPDNVSGGGGGNGNGNGTSDPPATRTIDVAACAGATSQADIDDNLKIVDQLEYNFYHAVTWGRLCSR